MKLQTKYLGLTLQNPVVVASSPFTSSLSHIVEMEKAGAGAIVLKSIFEEQILDESAFLDRYHDYPEAADYLRGYLGNEYVQNHLSLVRQAKASVKIPVIASINCMDESGWVDYAHKIEDAGADALELNIFLLPTSAGQTSAEIERHYLDIVSTVTKAVSIPVSVKLPRSFTNILNMARETYNRNAKGIVMFNRFIEPDIDIDNIKVVTQDRLSSNVELRNTIRSLAMCAPVVSDLDIAVSTGVHSGADLVKVLLAGAKAAEICTAIYKNGPTVIEEMKSYLADWMDKHSFDAVDQFTGLLANKTSEDYNKLYMRAQYMKMFQE